jgi:hypothetical protein
MTKICESSDFFLFFTARPFSELIVTASSSEITADESPSELEELSELSGIGDLGTDGVAADLAVGIMIAVDATVLLADCTVGDTT